MSPDNTQGLEPAESQRELTVKELTEALRSNIKFTAKNVLVLSHKAIAEPSSGGKELDGELIANIVIAFRHLEDSAMRLGKALQALNNGESIYDNSGVIGQK